jgi:hypothetical protein
MSTHLRPSSGWIGRLVLVIIGLIGVLGVVPNARAADDYSVALQTPDLIRQFEDVELTAVVQDGQGQPVNGLPVTFQVAPEWQHDTTLVPSQTLTRDGTASTVFQAAVPGVVQVTVQAGHTTQTTHITVTGAGSRVYDKQP